MFLLLKANLCDKIWWNMFFFWKYWAFGCWKTFRLSFPNKNMFPEIKVIFLNIFSGGQTQKSLAKWHGPWPKTGNLVKEVSWYADKRQQRQIWYVFLGSYKNIYCMQNLMLWICDWCWGTLIQDPNRLSLWLLDGLQRLKKKCASYDQLKHAVIWIWAGGIFAIWSKQNVMQMYVPSKICLFGWNTLCNVQR